MIQARTSLGKKRKSCEILKKMLHFFLSQQIRFYLNRSAGTREVCPLPLRSLRDWTSWYSIIWDRSSASKPPMPPQEELHWALFKLLSWWGWVVSPHFAEPEKGKGAKDPLPFATTALVSRKSSSVSATGSVAKAEDRAQPGIPKHGLIKCFVESPLAARWNTSFVCS